MTASRLARALALPVTALALLVPAAASQGAAETGTFSFTNAVSEPQDLTGTCLGAGAIGTLTGTETVAGRFTENGPPSFGFHFHGTSQLEFRIDFADGRYALGTSVEHFDGNALDTEHDENGPGDTDVGQFKGLLHVARHGHGLRRRRSGTHRCDRAPRRAHDLARPGRRRRARPGGDPLRDRPPAALLQMSRATGRPGGRCAPRTAAHLESMAAMAQSVLIVDDHAPFRARARTVLEDDGFRVVGEAADGEEAVAAAQRLRPEIVLLDVQLPDLDGFAVADRLAAEPDPPAVVLISSRSVGGLPAAPEGQSGARLHRQVGVLGGVPAGPAGLTGSIADAAAGASLLAGGLAVWMWGARRACSPLMVLTGTAWFAGDVAPGAALRASRTAGASPARLSGRLRAAGARGDRRRSGLFDGLVPGLARAEWPTIALAAAVVAAASARLWAANESSGARLPSRGSRRWPWAQRSSAAAAGRLLGHDESGAALWAYLAVVAGHGAGVHRRSRVGALGADRGHRVDPRPRRRAEGPASGAGAGAGRPEPGDRLSAAGRSRVGRRGREAARAAGRRQRPQGDLRSRARTGRCGCARPGRARRRRAGALGGGRREAGGRDHEDAGRGRDSRARGRRVRPAAGRDRRRGAPPPGRAARTRDPNASCARCRAASTALPRLSTGRHATTCGSWRPSSRTRGGTCCVSRRACTPAPSSSAVCARRSSRSRPARALEVELSVTDRRFPTAVEAAVFFVCSEGLANVVKHAAATRAVLTVAVDGRDLVARVSDDGRGGADRTGGSGLRGLEDRLAALGGTLALESPPGGGTRLTARLPISAA